MDIGQITHMQAKLTISKQWWADTNQNMNYSTDNDSKASKKQERTGKKETFPFFKIYQSLKDCEGAHFFPQVKKLFPQMGVNTLLLLRYAHKHHLA